MKILFFADLHMCPRASIIDKWGTEFPMRLENCIKTINWLERLAEEEHCDYIINLGDFFDKPDLSSETITASKKIKWSAIKHYSLVGNHDASISNLTFNSTNSLLSENHEIIAEPKMLELNDCEICFLPYVIESAREPLDSYFGARTNKLRIIVSHNDIKDIQLGPVISKTGFPLAEIEANCDLFLNGHLHNGHRVNEKVINLGNITGKDFGEDAFKYTHSVVILDTKTLALNFIENPNAFNFYKIQVESEQDFDVFNTLKPGAVLSIKCDVTMLETTKSLLNTLLDKVIASRIIITRSYEETIEPLAVDLSIDHLARFVECCKENIENSALLEEELTEICK